MTSLRRAHETPAPPCAARAVLLLATMALAFASWSFLAVGATVPASPFMLAAATLVSLAVVVCAVRWTPGGLHSISAAYVVLLWCFHFGLIVPLALGWSDRPAWLLGFEDGPVLLCLLLAFSALGAGMTAGGRKGGSRSGGSLPAAARANRLFAAGSAAFCLLIALAAWDASRIGILSLLTEAYNSALYRQSDLRLYKSTLNLAGPVLLIGLAGSTTTAQRRAGITVGALLMAFLFYSGDRSNAVFFALGLLFVLRHVGAEIRKPVLLAVILSVIAAGATVRAIRESEGPARSLSEGWQVVAESGALGVLEEMGTSLRPLIETLALVPRSFEFRHGGSYLDAVASAVPNLGASLRTLSPADEQLAPNLWITAVVEPSTFAAGGGLGYSGIAEPYLNFGYTGILVWFAALGYVLARLDATASESNRVGIAVRALFLVAVVTTVRNDMTNFVRPFFWPLLLMCGLLTIDALLHRVTRTRAYRTVSVPARI